MEFPILKHSYFRSLVRFTMLGILGATVSGCVAGAWSETVRIDSKVPMPQECAGWQKIELKPRTTMLLLREDPRLTMDIDAHNLKGRNLGCWQ